MGKIRKIVKASARFTINTISAGTALNAASRIGLNNDYIQASICVVTGGLTDVFISKPLTDKIEDLLTGKLFKKKTPLLDFSEPTVPSPAEIPEPVIEHEIEVVIEPDKPQATDGSIVMGKDVAIFASVSGIDIDIDLIDVNHVYRFFLDGGHIMMTDLGENIKSSDDEDDDIE
jgi:hypothetical protein